jgi:hypothetical protein
MRENDEIRDIPIDKIISPWESHACANCDSLRLAEQDDTLFCAKRHSLPDDLHDKNTCEDWKTGITPYPIFENQPLLEYGGPLSHRERRPENCPMSAHRLQDRNIV